LEILGFVRITRYCSAERRLFKTIIMPEEVCMVPRVALATACLWLLPLDAAEKKNQPVQTSNEIVQISGQAFADRKAVTGLLGTDPAMDLIVLDVKVSPRGESLVAIDLDDFTLISRKDGQRSQPLVPSQIAGKGALVVSSTKYGGGSGVMSQNRGPIWGGIPGSGDRPRRLGADEEGGTGGTVAESTAGVQNDRSENPLLHVLKDRVLPEKRTNEAVNGLLYFLFDGKHRVKDLELIYETPSGRLMLDFEK
jgi:hypothetical protein